ncbi:MAG TPA: DMT family transporter [Candidatus Competibacteraceae bacterium]|nr:DMT family transporter [Candidatus Competibacteraceae bacterium]
MSCPAPLAAVPARYADLGALVMLISGTVCIAASPILVRYTGMSAVDSAFWRLLMALPLLALWSWLLPGAGRVRLPRRRELLLLAVAGLAFAGDLGFFHAALARTSVANATFLSNLAPLLVVGMAWLAFGERPGRGLLAALGLALVGALLLAGDTRGRAGADLLGDALALGSAAFFGLYLVLVKALRARLAASVVMFGTTLVGMVALGLLALAHGGPALPSSSDGWLALLGLGLFAHALGQGLTALSLGRLAVGPSSLVLLLMPVLSAVAAWPLLGEQPSLAQTAGAAVVLAAILLAQRVRAL